MRSVSFLPDCSVTATTSLPVLLRPRDAGSALSVGGGGVSFFFSGGGFDDLGGPGLGARVCAGAGGRFPLTRKSTSHMSSESTGIRSLHAGHRLSRPGSKERANGIPGERCRSMLYRQKKSLASLIFEADRGGGGARDLDLGGGNNALGGGGRRGDDPRELNSITSASAIAGARGGGADCNSLWYWPCNASRDPFRAALEAYTSLSTPARSICRPL